MKRHVALLRGVNVGGRTIKSAELKACFEGLGFASVKTVLASGNVLFDAEASTGALKRVVEEGLQAAFSYPARAQVFTQERLETLIAACPYSGDEAHHVYVVFLESGLEDALCAEPVDLADGEHVSPGDGVVYWRCPKGLTLESRFGKLLAKASYRDANTNRNINTLRKLV